MAIITHYSDSALLLRMQIVTAFPGRNVRPMIEPPMVQPASIELVQPATRSRNSMAYYLVSRSFYRSALIFSQNDDSLLFDDGLGKGEAFYFSNSFRGKRIR